MSKTDTGAGVIDAMRTLLRDPEKLSETLMNQAQTLPTEEVMGRINHIVGKAAKAPPMPEDPEHIVALRDRAALCARMVYGYCVDHTIGEEEACKGLRDAFGPPLQLHGQEHPIDSRDRWWIWDLALQYRIYHDYPLEWGFDALMAYKLFPQVPFTSGLILGLQMHARMVKGAKERHELQ